MFENYQADTPDRLESRRVGDDCAMLAFSLKGRSHRSQDMPLQDCHALRALPNGWSLAVVCDGVGSKPCSDAGARLAANAFANFVTDFWGGYQDADSVRNLLKCAALQATGELRRAAAGAGRSVHDYSTTLHAVVWADGWLHWFHSGDGGIIALMEDGRLQPLTQPQKEGEYVLPLLEGPARWETGSAEARAQSVLLCTDGVYDRLAGPVLRKYGEGIDRGVAAFFLSPWAAEDWDDLEAAAARLSSPFADATEPNDFYPLIARAVDQGRGDLDAASVFVMNEIFSNDRPLHALKSIQDDITVALIQATARKPRPRPMEYYKGPDWAAINRSISEILYGHGGTN